MHRRHDKNLVQASLKIEGGSALALSLDWLMEIRRVGQVRFIHCWCKKVEVALMQSEGWRQLMGCRCSGCGAHVGVVTVFAHTRIASLHKSNV